MTHVTNKCTAYQSNLPTSMEIESHESYSLFVFSFFETFRKPIPGSLSLSTVIESLVLFQFNLLIKWPPCWTLFAGFPDPDRISLNVPTRLTDERLWSRLWRRKVYFRRIHFLWLPFEPNEVQSVATGDTLMNFWKDSARYLFSKSRRATRIRILNQTSWCTTSLGSSSSAIASKAPKRIDAPMRLIWLIDVLFRERQQQTARDSLPAFHSLRCSRRLHGPTDEPMNMGMFFVNLLNRLPLSLFFI